MAKITLKGNPINTIDNLPAVGLLAPDFVLTANDLAEKSLSDYLGKRIILNIFPSLDTSVCAASVRRFNVEASKLENAVVLCISADLPFAQARFCGAEGIENVETLSSFRSDFAEKYGVKIIDGPMKGLSARAVIVINENGHVIYQELVPEIVQEPDYEKALNVLN
ncbi:MAG TPA: thiol peroxidase [Candidatus Cloacimonadota bacterium]|jgi:thiol peroxidase|nr:thiol peroxidase [Candidatus Cloacimonadales bacterium]HOE90885.1 thiol peroxidase [Candidatus Cloacimonadota bacterium]HOQ79566.1 thiol peroxidase [Candidatus Cloacimonadota bacterium]HPK41489.1 thiol peroxidase [Candidatus Cloacimonadota bacterium]HPY96898.1 thiol peroxidase [Candidatus Cloacimonadota bacterium]